MNFVRLVVSTDAVCVCVCVCVCVSAHFLNQMGLVSLTRTQSQVVFST